MLNPSLFVLGGIAFGVACFGMTAQAESSRNRENKSSEVNHVLPQLAIDGLPEVWLQGSPVKDWEKDKVYIFEFWATWCGPCLAAMPHMEQLHQVFKDEPLVQIIGVNVMDRKSPDVLKEFLKNRPTTLTYTMAVDVDGKKTKDRWLTPQKVQGIPHVFAVKNGQLIWRGHPLNLTDKMLMAMMKPDFSAKDFSTKRFEKKEQLEKAYRKMYRDVEELMRRGKKTEALAVIKQVQDAGQLSQNQLIHLKMLPFVVLAQLGQTQDAQMLLNEVSKEYLDNYRVQLDIAKKLMEQDLIPADKMDTNLVERCLNRCIELAQKEKREDFQPWRMMAELRERQGDMKAAVLNMERALSLTSLCKNWSKWQQLSGKDETFQMLVEQVAEELKSVPARKVQEMGEVKEDERFSPLFKKLKWVNHPGLKGLPSGKTVFISFWRNGVVSMIHGENAPGRILDAVLKKYELFDHSAIRCIVLGVTPMNEKQMDRWLAKMKKQTIYPVGIPSDYSVVNLLDELKLDSFPAAAVIRDGTLLWAGEIRRMPEWVAKIAIQESFDKKRFAEDVKTREELVKSKREILLKYIELGQDKKREEGLRLLKENVERFSDDGWFMFTLAKDQAEKAWRCKDYQGAVKIFEGLLEQFPKEESLASYVLKILNGADEFKAYNYKAVRLALGIMKGANSRGEGEYNAACLEEMMKRAMEQGDYIQAREDALNALRELPLMKQYATMSRTEGGI